MLRKINIVLQKLVRRLDLYKWWLAGAGVAGGALLAGLLILSYELVAPYQKYVIPASDTAALQNLGQPVGVVLGAGITKDGKPFKELQARLDVAADALNQGTVRKLLLSGDNRFKWYDEPKAMHDYLLNTKHIAADKLQVDDAGRSTYESCDRAAHIFGLERQNAILFSAGSHLPRAIYLCRQFGVRAYGISSNVEANNSGRREVLARAKAVFNVYIYGEKTILGAPISL